LGNGLKTLGKPKLEIVTGSYHELASCH